MIGVFADQNMGDHSLCRQPAGVNRAGAGACTTPSVQERQAYLGRRVTMTRNWAGITSSRSETSSPMQCSSPPQPQTRFWGSIISSIRGRCLGSEPRLALRGLAGRRASRSSASSSAWTTAIAVSRSSSASSTGPGRFFPIDARGRLLERRNQLFQLAIRSSLRRSRTSAAISIALRVAMSSESSAASSMVRNHQIRRCRSRKKTSHESS